MFLSECAELQNKVNRTGESQLQEILLFFVASVRVEVIYLRFCEVSDLSVGV
jgi:hypothetical protein